MNKPRRLGVVTAICHSCLTPNGVRLSLHFFFQTAVYQCCNPDCRKHNRITIDSQLIELRPDYLGSAQQGVKFGGVE